MRVKLSGFFRFWVRKSAKPEHFVHLAYFTRFQSGQDFWNCLLARAINQKISTCGEFSRWSRQTIVLASSVSASTGAGNSRTNTAPLGQFSSNRRPPSDFAIGSQRASPSPTPGVAFAVARCDWWKGSNNRLRSTLLTLGPKSRTRNRIRFASLQIEKRMRLSVDE